MVHVDIYTDGACSGNPGKGGWAAILMSGQKRKEIYGGIQLTTNNQMELTAAIEGLRALKTPAEVCLYSDSAYLVNAFNEHWIRNWIQHNWRTKSGPVKNIDLWLELIDLTRIHDVTWTKVKGHSDNVFNNRCDELARQGIADLICSKAE